MEGKEEGKAGDAPLPKNEPVLCLLGTTGCGKSTFCHLI